MNAKLPFFRKLSKGNWLKESRDAKKDNSLNALQQIIMAVQPRMAAIVLGLQME